MRKQFSLIIVVGLIGFGGLAQGDESSSAIPSLPPALMEKAREQAEIDGAAVQKTTEKVRALAETMTLPENKHKEAGQKAAEETNAVYRSQEFQDKVKRYEDSWEELVPGIRKVKREQEEKGVLADSEQIYLFLSSSIPVASFNGYMATLNRAPEVVPVMRGMVGGLGKEKKKERVAWWRSVLKQDTTCKEPETPEKLPCDLIKPSVTIKPSLFHQYEITEVPALVYVRGDEIYQVQGDVGLNILLEKINQEAKSPGLASVITKIRGNHD